MNILSRLIILLFLISCNSHPTTKSSKDSLTIQSANSGEQKLASNAETFSITPALLTKYREACEHDTAAYDKKLVSNFFGLIKKFDGKKLDTTILTFGNIDGDSDQDTISTRVYYNEDSIYVDSKWIRNNHILWRDNYVDPYTDLNANLFTDSGRNTWICFAIGVLYGPPDFYPRTEMTADSIVYSQGVEDLDSAGIHTDIENYKAYLRDFKGELITCGQPESRERLWIWYKPANRMITYYQP
ncbi:MAG TPA: hypothetical protein VG605_23415 [Puia sp.]|nr:hypothetical protein [Puia sp.]